MRARSTAWVFEFARYNPIHDHNPILLGKEPDSFDRCGCLVLDLLHLLVGLIFLFL
ncbi:hypothetical protein M407DRAFT_192052 [Tulasnella calospora MUT 4182]|uniref:Uncharacterized protein n=1 Tax=Tulasnella calospora MUT 4182 TaxID=1051891 RepID=A0A0C3MIC3_9AGAM|nr:hypothetical protein M407DRAFT_192052 [Tulasnella calospora MUT 4182]